MVNLEGWLEAHARQKQKEREQQHGQHGCVHDQDRRRTGVGFRSSDLSGMEEVLRMKERGAEGKEVDDEIVSDVYLPQLTMRE